MFDWPWIVCVWEAGDARPPIRLGLSANGPPGQERVLWFLALLGCLLQLEVTWCCAGTRCCRSGVVGRLVLGSQVAALTHTFGVL
mmetsp:Transcript_71565/g.141959  ORF Transcript_71565/g.141959 Transcript_71565/m.141959 type:complete len:85 (+) Transcript_71565:2374-2628(+)